MMLCNSCGKFSDARREDFCAVCGAKNWALESTLSNSVKDEAKALGTCFIMTLVAVISIAVTIAILFGVVFFLHWMWRHS